MLKSTVAALWLYWMDADSGPVAPSGMMDAALRLARGMISVSERFTYTVGGRVRDMCPSVLNPRLVLTDATFELRSLWRKWTVTYVRLPSISGIVEFLKILTSFPLWGVKN